MIPFLNLQSLGAFALILGLLVLIHELGHFLVAKFLGIGVEVFSIGFGPRLFGFRKKGTDYRLSAIPLGGYVKMRGENPDETLSGDPEEFLSRPKPQRFAVLVMGATMNIAAAIFLMVVVYRAGIPEPAYLHRPAVVGAVEPGSPAARAGIHPDDLIVRLGENRVGTWSDLLTTVTLSPGQEVPLVLDRGGRTLTQTITLGSATVYRIGYAGILPVDPAQVDEVVPGLPADQAGVKAGDRFLAVNGEPIRNYLTAWQVIQNSPGRTVSLRIERDGRLLELSVVPKAEEGKGVIGIRWRAEKTLRRYPLYGALAASLKWNWENVDLVFTTLRKLLTRQISLRTMSGPIDIYKFSGAALREGWLQFLQFMALVSLQLGVINLMPFPVLDGGHIFILLLEGVVRRDLSFRIKERIMQVGFYLLLLLMGAIVYLDISKNFFLR